MINPYLLLLHITASVNLPQKVVALLVARLVSPNRQHQVSQSRSVVKPVVVHCVLSCRSLFPMTQRSPFPVDVAQNHCVVLESCFFQVAVELVAESWAYQVSDEIQCCEHCLLHYHEKSHQDSRLVQCQHREKVEPFVVRFLQQMVNPPSVSLHQPQSSQIPANTPHHSRNE